MTNATLPPELCDCCGPSAPRTPVLVTNRPGLTAIAYRIGTFASFREAMLEALAQQPALRGLTTRQSDDPAITLLELWAAVADVLTFYQERIANEAFLRTTRERDSVLRLARLLDYHLRPGLAATTRLVFTADDGATVKIPVGLRVMSVPGQDEQPQIFETVEAITADARLNRVAVLPQPQAVNPFAAGRSSAFLTPDNAGWLAAKELKAGQKVVLYKEGSNDTTVVKNVSFSQSFGWGVPARVAAPAKPWTVGASFETAVSDWLLGWRGIFQLAIAPVTSTAPEEKEIKVIRVERDRFLLVWTSPIVGTSWNRASTKVRVFVRKLRMFGHDAPGTILTVTTTGSPPTPVFTPVTVPVDFSGTEFPLDAVYKDLVAGDELLIWEQGHDPVRRTIADLSTKELVLGADSLVSGSLVDQRFRATVTVATLSSSVSITNRRNVTVYLLKGSSIPLWPRDFDDVIVIGAPGGAATGSLYLPAVPLDSTGNAVEIGRTIQGQELKSGVGIRLDEINLGRTVLLKDHAQDPVPATITGVSLHKIQDQDVGDQFFLVLDVETLAQIQLESGTAELFGNVAQATHGETVKNETLGSGDSATPFQRFTLKKSPLTYVPSATNVRGDNTLQIIVNGERWTQAASLFGQPPTALAFTARQNDDQTTTVQFGDGVTGARLPTGQGNVLATYRKGVGLAGRVKADQLSIPLDHPVGLKAVTNPAQAKGGADPESLEGAREAAPTTVKTFDRAVSLLDFETLATSSGIVARAKATWVWRGLEKAVHLTVAGQAGAVFSIETLKTLHDALTAQRDPNHPLLVANVCRVPIVVGAKLQVDGRFDPDAVGKAARQALEAFFAFEQRGFGAAVHLSDVYRVLQDVTGVAAVDVTELHFKGHATWTAAQRAVRGVTADPVQAHLRIFAARPQAGAADDPLVAACFGATPPDVLPTEQAYLQTPADDIALDIGVLA